MMTETQVLRAYDLLLELAEKAGFEVGYMGDCITIQTLEPFNNTVYTADSIEQARGWIDCYNKYNKDKNNE